VPGVTDPVRALDALLAELTSRGSPLAKYLEPGLAADHVDARLRELGSRPHSDVIDLYGWHNGFDRFRVPTSSNGLVSLVPSHQEFNPLEEAAKLYVQWREIAERLAATPIRDIDGAWRTIDPEETWSRSWFPIFQGGGSEAIFINNGDHDAGSVWLHPVQDAPRRLFDTLADAIDGVRQALVDGRLRLDGHGVFTLESSIESGLML
jgi:cell wall assembly regulator SMI1